MSTCCCCCCCLQEESTTKRTALQAILGLDQETVTEINAAAAKAGAKGRKEEEAFF